MKVRNTKVIFVSIHFEKGGKGVFDYSKLYGRMAEKGETTESLAKKIGRSSNTLRNKLHNRVSFTQNEISAIIKVLDIEKSDIPIYFFVN